MLFKKYFPKFFVARNVKWVPAANGVIPTNAVVGGYRQNFERIYIGRAVHQNRLIVGKIVPRNGVLYIPYGGKEHKFTQYEQLVYVPKLE